MLKIKNKVGKTIMVLKDDVSEPELLEADVLVDQETGEVEIKKAKTDKELAEEEGE